MKHFNKIIIYCSLLLISFYLIVFKDFYCDMSELFTQDNLILLELRATQFLIAFAIGSNLSVSGVAYQAILRNVLAEPFILGVSGGASLGASLMILGDFSRLNIFFLPLGAFLGSVVAISLVFVIAHFSDRGNYSNNALLGGVIIGSVASSLLMFVISVMGSAKLNSISWWMLGSLQLYNSELITVLLIVTFGGTLSLFLFGREINAIAMGDELSHNFGVKTKFISVLVLVIASLMAGISVAMVGIISFVGLIVPHIMRKLFGAEHRRLIFWSMLGGGLFLNLCSLVSVSIFQAQEIPIGVVTALLGGPFFIYLLVGKSGRSQL